MFNAIQKWAYNLISRTANEDPLIVWDENYSINPVCSKQENAHQPRAECQNNPIDLNFHLQKSL